MQAENYDALVIDYYLRRKGTRKGKTRQQEFHRQLTAKELSLIPSGKKVLDTGSGDGYFAKLLQQYGNSVSCVELSDELILMTRTKGLNCVKADLNVEIPFPSSQFDLIFAREVIEHLFNPFQYFKEAYRTLKKGGKLIITTSNAAHLRTRLKLLLLGDFPVGLDVKYWTPKTLKHTLRKEGFHVQFPRSLPLWMYRSIICVAVKPE